jgi:hypothetical protein
VANGLVRRGAILRHYVETKWIDFVRGLVPGREREAMQAHLDTGCSRCRRVAGLLRTTATVAAADSRWAVPDGAVHMVKAFFALQQPETVHILPRVLSRLVYDSFRDPMPAGVRVQHGLSRQTLYEAGPYSVDLRLEHERGSLRVTLVGQIANRKQPESRLAEVPVLLMSGKVVVARALSNQLGEFQMEYEPARHLRLFVPVEQRGEGIEVRLGGLASRRKDKN